MLEASKKLGLPKDKCLEVFAKYDKDKNGTIDLNEWKVLVSELRDTDFAKRLLSGANKGSS